ncbi:EscU/YscU/HrcU family type III secretion system export apparatus switch protein [Rummeliibacillus sp. JY-2-4R]
MTDEKNMRKEAVALSYNKINSNVPKVIAKGKGKIADNILEQAALHHVPIQQDPTLVQLLGQLDLNESIPEELYQAVAEVFAFIYRLDQKHESL